MTAEVAGESHGLRSSFVVAPLQRPLAAWFEAPVPDTTSRIVVTDEGQVYGPLLVAGLRSLVTLNKPHSFELFHRHHIETADGAVVEAGCIRVGAAHAPVNLSLQDTIDHYDTTGRAAAAVRVRRNDDGLWFAGGVWPGSTVDDVRVLRTALVCGYWWLIEGTLTLIGAVDLKRGPEPPAFLELLDLGASRPAAGEESLPPPIGTPVQVLVPHGLSVEAAGLLAGVFGSAENLAASLARHADRLCAGGSIRCPWDQPGSPAEHLSEAEEASRAWSAVGWLERGLGKLAAREARCRR